jgi:hypothetical protein
VRVLAPGNAVGDVDERVQAEEDGCSQRGGPAAPVPRDGQPAQAQRSDEKCATDVADEVDVERPRLGDAGHADIPGGGRKEHPDPVRGEADGEDNREQAVHHHRTT